MYAQNCKGIDPLLLTVRGDPFTVAAMGEVFTNPEAVIEALREVKAARELVCDLLIYPSQDDARPFADTMRAEQRLRRAEVLLTLSVEVQSEDVSG